MLAEAFRHSKAIGGWGDTEQCLADAGIPLDAVGLAVGTTPAETIAELGTLIAAHRVRERFPTTV